jgi:hypothetical protein
MYMTLLGHACPAYLSALLPYTAEELSLEEFYQLY